MIKLRKISKSYQRPGEGELKVLNGIDFEVAAGAGNEMEILVSSTAEKNCFRQKIFIKLLLISTGTPIT